MLRRAGRGCKHFARNISPTTSTCSTSQLCLSPHPRFQRATISQSAVQDGTQSAVISDTRPEPSPFPSAATSIRLPHKYITTLLKDPPRELLEFIEKPIEGLTGRQLLRRVPRVVQPLNGRRSAPWALFTHTRQLVDLSLRLLDTLKPSLALHALVIARHVRKARLNDRRVWERMAHGIAMRKQWVILPDLLALARTSMGTLNVRLMNWWTRSLVETFDYAALNTVFRAFEQEGLKPDRTTYHLMISGFIRNRNPYAAMNILDILRVRGMPVDASTHAIIASSYRSLGPDLDVKHQGLQALKTANPVASAAILNALLQLSIDSHESEWIGIVLELLGLDHIDLYRAVNPHGSSFLPDGEDLQDEDITLSAQAIEAVTTFRISRNALRVRPDVATYTILLNYAAVNRDLDSAISLLAHMQGHRTKPDDLLICALIRVFFAVDRPLAAVRVAADIYSTNRLARRTLVALANDVPGNENEEFPFIATKPSVAVLNALASGLHGVLGLSGFNRILTLMYACNLQPDGRTIEILVAHLLSDENASPQIIMATVQHLLPILSSLSPRHCDVLLQAVVRRAKRASGRSAWIPKRTREQYGVSKKPSNIDEVLTVIGGDDALDGPTAGLELVDPADNELFKPMTRSLAARGVRANKSMLGIRIQYEAARQNMSTAQEIFQTMLDQGMYMTAHHYAMLMDGYAAAGDVESALRVMRSAEEAGVTLNVVMYTILITAYARAGEPDLATRTVSEMIERGIRPDVPAIDAAVSAYAHLELWHAARRTLLTLWPQNYPPPEHSDKKTIIQLMRELHAHRSGRQVSSRKLTKVQQEYLVLQLSVVLKRMLREAKTYKKRHPARISLQV